MESVLKLVQQAETVDVALQEENRKLLDELKEVARLLTCTDAWFEMECDSDLIDACIYQREALQARYRYLLNAAKRQGVSAVPFQV